MPLPGKLCIGILEEDNPQKSYFCFKPMLIEENGLYIPFEQHDAYPEDGCIRIVPDKNESSHFKARMRKIGLFAVVDLREHPGENDKIRQNKNFHADDSERNANIIYSDVVRAPAQNMIFSLLTLRPEEAENAILPQLPGTEKVMLRPENALLDGAWQCEPTEDEDSVRLLPDPEPRSAEGMQIFDLSDFRQNALSFAIVPPNLMPSVAEPIAARAEKSAPPADAVENKPSPAEARPAAEAKEPKPTKEGKERKETKKQPPAEEACEPKEEKPWICRSNMVFGADCAVGLNPRRGRSLMEVIDDKWKHSRLDQLGHAVDELSTNAPVQSPVDAVIDALRYVWSSRDQREVLTDAIVHLDGAEIAMDARRTALRESAVNAQLNELEAQRLKMLDDMEQLKRNQGALRETLKQEIRRDEAAAFAEAVHKTEEAQLRREQFEAEADRARSAAESVHDALNSLNDGRFEKRLQEFAVTSRAVELLRKDSNAPLAPEPKIVGCAASAEELVLRVRTCFADAGCSISHTDAVNLLICAAQSPILLVSGAPGSGKSTMVRLLARALGVEGTHLFAFAPGTDALNQDEALQKRQEDDVPALVLLDDMNLAAMEDPARGLYPAAEAGRLTLCGTVQDDAHALPTTLLSRAFLIRLAEEAPDSAWMPKESASPKPYAPVSLSALQAAFAPSLNALPPHVVKRMNRLRSELALLGIRLSRGTLNALWRYSAAAIPLMPIEPSAVLDMALAQRALPAILSSAPVDALAALPKLLSDLPRCKALLEQSLPIEV